MMNWLGRLLGLGESEIAAEKRRHGEFLADLCGDDRTALVQFENLLLDRKGAASTLKEQWGRVSDRFLEDIALLHVADENSLLAGIDWAAAPDDILEGFESLAKRLRLPAFTDGLLQFASEIEQAARGHHVGLMYPKLVDWAKDLELRVIDLNSGSDMYRFGLLPPRYFDKWVGTKLSDQLKVEDPSWQFKK